MAQLDKQILLTQKFKELLLEFCRIKTKYFLTKWLQRIIGIVQRKSKSYNERVTYDEFIAASYGE
jgi:hypothetical protein